MSHAIN